MSSTNKTTNYELSQFLGTDKPAWLSDYNSDMGKIDAQMKLNADGITTASGASTTNATNIGTLANLTTDSKTNLVSAINEVDSHADSASTTASTASVNASSALAGLAKFDLDSQVNLTISSNLGVISQNTLKIRKDSTGSVYKLYGQIDVTGLSNLTGNLTLTITNNSGLTPSSAYDVECAGLVILTTVDGTNVYPSIGARKFHVNTNGTITIPSETLTGNVTNATWIFSPCLYFNTSFGD